MSTTPARIDVYPTHEYHGYLLRPGRPYPFGATIVSGGINFSVFSRHATSCELVLFKRGESLPFIEIPFRGEYCKPESDEKIHSEFRIGNVFTMTIFDLDPESIEYGYRMAGPGPQVERGRPGLHRFDTQQILLDPYAKAVGGRDVWGARVYNHDRFQHRGRIISDDFDWESDRPLETPIEELIIYEMHVRGFTRHPSSGVKHPGTYAGLREKIPYLRRLGVNCVELMPIFEFDELENQRIDPTNATPLRNYWGYNTVGFFAPKAGFAASGRSRDGTMVADELKTLVKELHRNGIEVVLDVVFNHTAEGNEYGPTISFRGIDNTTYYMLNREGFYFNFSGTGNTMNCNHPIVRNMVLDCLRYWVSEYHVDGFRFDLAAILGRSQSGDPLANPPLLEILAHDPVLARCKLIAEAWDAGGLYQVGTFPAYGRWTEWNGKYRDTIRRFLKGDKGQIWEMAQGIQGSPNLYAERGPTASVNFVTCHDGFTLHDLFAYDQKHNEANGEDNRDGANDNNSWNCGWEGPCDDPQVNALRMRLVKNAVAILMISRGVPMILMGDELNRTQLGNNNTYCHDDELSWLDWTNMEKHADLLRFFRLCIAFRRDHPVLRAPSKFQREKGEGSDYADISWHGTQAWNVDWSVDSRSLACLVCGRLSSKVGTKATFIYTAMNMHWESWDFELPKLPDDQQWHLVADTSRPSPEDFCEPGSESVIANQQLIGLGSRSVAILIGK